MDLLIVDALPAALVDAVASRHRVRVAPELAFDPAALHDALLDVRTLILPAGVRIDDRLLRGAPRLRAIGRITEGAENIDTEACARAGVEIVRSAGGTALAEAEFAIGALLSMLRRTPVTTPEGARVGREIGGATVGLVGLTPGARAMARLLASFGARVVGYDPSVHRDDGVWGHWRVEPLGLRELLQASDAVSVQLGFFSRYRGLIGERLLPYCKPQQVVLSIGHSALFDAEALAAALQSGRIAAVWLDSLEPGALQRGQPLAGLENVQVTPRIAGSTVESRQRCAEAVLRRIEQVLRDTEPARARAGLKPLWSSSSARVDLPGGLQWR